MGFSDLKFGWEDQTFVLSDVVFSSGIQLQELYEEEWEPRRGTWSGLIETDDEESRKKAQAIIDDYEDPKELRFAPPRRFLTAKAAVPDDTLSTLSLGIPEDKQAQHVGDTRLDYLKLQIQDQPPYVRKKHKGRKEFDRGVIFHREESEYSDEATYVSLSVPPETFDQIEELASQPGVEINITINLKGWHWLGPIGDTQVYVDKGEDHGAELAEINIRKVLPNAQQRDDDQPQVSDDTYARASELKERAINPANARKEFDQTMKSTGLGWLIFAVVFISLIYLAMNN